MTTQPDRYERVVGVCRAIRDFTFVLRAHDLERARKAGLVGSGVSFPADDRFQHVKRELQARYARHERVDAGGPVSNTIYAMGARLATYPRPFQLEWTGPYAVDISYVRGDPIASLRTVGVAISATPDEHQSLLESICIVSGETGEAEAVIVGPRPARSRRLPTLGEGDLALVQLADLAEFVGSVRDDAGVRIAVFTADCQELTDSTRRALDDLAGRSKIRFAFGKLDEFRRLGLLGDAGAHGSLTAAEVVATGAAEPVQVWQGSVLVKELDVPRMSGPSEGSFVGAGDAYAGAYLCARLLGKDIETAHDWGASEARLASYSPSARRTYSANLTELFGPHIERQSETPDWGLHARIRQTAGLTVLSCGTTGVDELALEVARRWGLAAFAITKRRGGAERADPDRGELGDAHHVELGSPSNRYCTWANVFLADGTLLLDFAGTEGSETTRTACATLNRPILELAEVAPGDIDAAVRSWIERNAVRVLHVAGNRAPNLPASRREEARYKIERAVRVAATTLGGNTSPKGAIGRSAGAPARRQPRVGLPHLTEVREIVYRYLDSQGGRHTRGAAVEEHDGVQLCFGRSLDLIKMVDRGVLDFALVGLDMVSELGEGAFAVRELLGVFNTVLAVVAPSAPRFAPRRLVAQYPRVAGRHFAREDTEIVPIAGMAETWVSTGEFDGAVDTWRTGRTAEASGLTFVDAIASTSLVVVEGSSAPAGASRFIDGFVKWVREGLDEP